ncbi:MAG: succinate dehydrogenase, cytochrome b556 subunit [Caldimonas sp.]
MATSLKEQPLKRRPVYTNIHVSQIIGYRLPPAAWSSILHRISGALMFLLMPFVIWLFDVSLGSEVSYERFRAVFAYGALGLPAWFVKLVTFGLIWAYLFHFCAGLRHVWMDATHAVDQKFGHVSAIVVMALSTAVALALGAKLFL